ncbi:MAG: RNA-dependent RNA polymerase [Sanya totivirus 8]|nr:MAG: RNA-dependent RNA polymerase [Sanya totivirus 8]
MHVKSVHVLGHHQLAKTIKGILRLVDGKMRKFSPTGMEDDYVRQHLKELHNIAFPRIVDEGPAWMFLCHLHALGGRRPFEMSEIIGASKDWVDGREVFEDREYCGRQLDKVFGSWGRSADPTLYLTFPEYCRDVMRWGTAGGCKKSTVRGKTFRTKWAWGLSRVMRPGRGDREWEYAEVDMYKASQDKDQHTAIVALKEEATKTREVITTPMASYLRQSYLQYRWGRPPLDSPIGRKSWLGGFQRTRYAWYGAIDGQRFDHHVPAWFVEEVIRRMGDIEGDGKEVAEEEIEHLRKLHIRMPNGELVKYRGGVLSGWRLTSLIDSLVSYCAGQYVLDRTNSQGAIHVGMMGDDIILYSNTKTISKDKLVEYYDAFGLETNASKTTTGGVGEFLRKVYCPTGVLGYPALALKSVMWANPWIGNYDPTSAQEVSVNWLTWYSRLLPFRLDEKVHSWVQKALVDDLHRWNPVISKGDYDKFIRTPISAGGGGPIEWSKPAVWTVLTRDPGSRSDRFFQHFGLAVEKETVTKRDYTVHALDYGSLYKTAHGLSRTSGSTDTLRLPRNVNLTRAVVNWFFDPRSAGTAISGVLGIRVPNGLRVAGKAAILDYIMGANSAHGGLTTVQTTPDTMGRTTRLTRFVTSLYLNKKIQNKIRNIQAAVTIYGMVALSHVSCVRGTW